LHNVWAFEGRRFDIALDDYRRRISDDELLEICKKDGYRLAKKCSSAGSKERGEKFNTTVYIGSRESEKYLRFYNAEIRHGLPCDRWEAEFKRRHAFQAFRELCQFSLGLESEAFEGLASVYLASLVTGTVDFVDVENAKDGERYDRLKRLPFWQSIIDDVGGFLRLSPPRIKPTLERSLKWFKRQVACFLSMVRKSYGHQYFYRWLDVTLKDGEKRFGSYHKSVIQAVQNEFSKELFTDQMSDFPDTNNQSTT
jgi:DNA relaxase NicK